MPDIHSVGTESTRRLEADSSHPPLGSAAQRTQDEASALWDSETPPSLLDGEDAVPDAEFRLGRFRIEKLLGRGGFAEVWRSYDPELGRTIAIKRARADREISAETLRCLREEARKAASLTHPGITRIDDVSTENESFLIVSEYIDGPSLCDRLRQGPVTVDQAVSIVIDIAQALHHAHKHDLVHRDVKPGNILLQNNGTTAVLTDFGLALLERELPSRTHELSGTIRFMSPEQARGDLTHIDHRSDIFSLGLVFYSMLSGRLPYPDADSKTYLNLVGTREPRPLGTISPDSAANLQLLKLLTPQGSRIPLLDKAPRLLAWYPGDGRGAPVFDPVQQQLSIRSERTRCFVYCAHLESRPFQVRTSVHVDDWLGYAGILWGFRLDEDAFPTVGYRCLGVEYFRSDVMEPSKLMASEFEFEQVAYDELRFVRRRPIAEQVIPRPTTEEMILKMDVNAENVRVRFGDNIEWSPTDILGLTDWLPAGEGSLGLIGQGHNTGFRSFSIRSLR